jgi:hypothetical protein
VGVRATDEDLQKTGGEPLNHFALASLTDLNGTLGQSTTRGLISPQFPQEASWAQSLGSSREIQRLSDRQHIMALNLTLCAQIISRHLAPDLNSLFSSRHKVNLEN